jgi:hypothetical protein
MMLHQDGSRHAWLGGPPALDLIVTLDDATGTIYSAFLAGEEGTASTCRALKEVFSERGLPMSLYTDRGAHYFHTPKAGGQIDRVIRPRSAGRKSNWASSISGPIRPIARRETGVLPNALGQGPFGAHVRDAAESFRQGTGTCRHHRYRCGQRLHPRGLFARPQRPFRR